MGVVDPLYDEIGRRYSRRRRADPRIAAALWRALGDAEDVVNVGAGTGAYEPDDREVVAVEPSAVMIAQRAAGSAAVVQAAAEQLPLADNSVDAAMSVFSDHHWSDRRAGLQEMLRVARRRVVMLNADPWVATRFWLTREYLPEFVDLVPARWRERGHWQRELRSVLGEVRLGVVPVPHDCLDGFYQAYWRRPHAYLELEVRDTISVFHRIDDEYVNRAVEHLRADLDSGDWQRRHAGLLARTHIDVGLRVVVADARATRLPTAD